MKRKLVAFVSLFSLVIAIAMVVVTPATPALAYDQYPTWDRDVNNVIQNGYYSGTNFTRLWDIYSSTPTFWNKVAVKNNTGTAWTIRTKVIPQTSNQIMLASIPGYPDPYFVYDLDAGVTATCWEAATGGEAWGCQIYMPHDTIAWIYVASVYSGDNTPSWYNTQYYIYDDTYTQTLAGTSVYVTLH
jgi:hypothetical protein